MEPRYCRQAPSRRCTGARAAARAATRQQTYGALNETGTTGMQPAKTKVPSQPPLLRIRTAAGRHERRKGRKAAQKRTEEGRPTPVLLRKASIGLAGRGEVREAGVRGASAATAMLVSRRGSRALFPRAAPAAAEEPTPEPRMAENATLAWQQVSRQTKRGEATPPPHEEGMTHQTRPRLPALREKE